MRKIGEILGIIERNWEFLVKIWEKLGGVWVELNKFKTNWGVSGKYLNKILGNIWEKKSKLRYVFIEISIISVLYILSIYVKKIKYTILICTKAFEI